MLVPMRMHLEGLTAKEAVNAVLQDNIHGLELDQRCVELAAFALALEAWRYPGAGGYRVLPELQLACSGMSINEAQKEWKDLVKGDEALIDAITWMQHTFKDAPILGSLIDPTKALKEGQTPPWELLQDAFINKVEASSGAKITAQGLVKASGLLANSYSWVITNVPYLARGKQNESLKLHADKYYKNEKNDLATVFLSKCLDFAYQDSLVSVVLPQNWLFLTSYRQYRQELLGYSSWDMLVRLGPGAFETISGEVVKAVLISIQKSKAIDKHELHGIDVSAYEQKLIDVKKNELLNINQLKLINNPDSRVSFECQSNEVLLEQFAKGLQGISPADAPSYSSYFWELPVVSDKWCLWQGATKTTTHFGGRSLVLDYGPRLKKAVEQGQAYIRGVDAIGETGVSIRQVGTLPATIYSGNFFDTNNAVILPKKQKHFLPIWCFCCSPQFYHKIRSFDQKLNVTNASLVKVPFDLEYWTQKALELYPNGIPKPYSDDFTQWLFHGHPCASVIWDEETKTTALGELRQDDTVMQVAVARLLGYQWPAELDDEMELAPEMRQVMLKNTDFDGLVDDCLLYTSDAADE